MTIFHHSKEKDRKDNLHSELLEQVSELLAELLALDLKDHPEIMVKSPPGFAKSRMADSYSIAADF